MEPAMVVLVMTTSLTVLVWTFVFDCGGWWNE
jgi:hypothetical protein